MLSYLITLKLKVNIYLKALTLGSVKYSKYFNFFIECTINVNDRFKQVQPLYLNQRFTKELLPSTSDGSIVIRAGSKIGICCPGYCEKLTCVEDKEFETEDDTTLHIINDLVCPRTDKFEPVVKQTGQRCADSGEWLQSGLEFGPAAKKKYIELYRVCYSLDNSAPIFVVYDFTRANIEQQPNVDCPSTWFHRGFFGDISNPNSKYSKKSVLNSLTVQLGSREKAEELVDDTSATRFLARGHLLPKNDFVFAPAKLSTCSLVSFDQEFYTKRNLLKIFAFRPMLYPNFNQLITETGHILKRFHTILSKNTPTTI